MENTSLEPGREGRPVRGCAVSRWIWAAGQQPSTCQGFHFGCVASDNSATKYGPFYGGFPKMGTPPNGWLISWKLPWFEMDDDWGYPYSRKPPYTVSKILEQLQNDRTSYDIGMFVA